MLFFFEIMFLILGFCSLGMALYYGKENGVIKVFHEVKNLEAMDEVQNNAVDEYGYEDEIYGEVTSADLRKAREDESSELSDREKRRKREENKRKENKPETKQEKKRRMFNLNDSEAETDLIRKNILAPRISTIVDLVADESALDLHGERTSGDGSRFADEEETGFMDDSSVFVDNNEEETGFMGTCSVSRNSAYSKDSDSDFADEEETGFMSSAMSLSQASGKKKKNAETRENIPKENMGNMESGSAEIPVSENIRFFTKDEEETGFMRKDPIFQKNEKKVIENPADVSRIEDDEETSFMGISLD